MTQPDIYTVEARRRSAEQWNRSQPNTLRTERILAGEYDSDPDQLALAATLRELNWQPPIDPDLVEARKIAAGYYWTGDSMETASAMAAQGQNLILAAIKRGRELAARGDA